MADHALDEFGCILGLIFAPEQLHARLINDFSFHGKWLYRLVTLTIGPIATRKDLGVKEVAKLQDLGMRPVVSVQAAKAPVAKICEDFVFGFRENFDFSTSEPVYGLFGIAHVYHLGLRTAQ